jgi:hypothetical protein
MNRVVLRYFALPNSNNNFEYFWGTEEGERRITEVNKRMVSIPVIAPNTVPQFSIDKSEVDWMDENQDIASAGFDPRNCPSAREVF